MAKKTRKPEMKRTFSLFIRYFLPNGKLHKQADVEWSLRFNEVYGTPVFADAVSKIRGLRDNGGPGALPGLPAHNDGWPGYILIHWREDPWAVVLVPPAITLQKAWFAGFRASGEGFNGEYPFHDKQNPAEADERLQARFKEWYESESKARPTDTTPR